MLRLPFTIRLIRLSGIRMSRESRLRLIPRSSSSSFSNSPGGTGGSLRLAMMHRLPSVIIHDLNVPGIAVFPREADSPLFIQSNTVLSFAVPRKRLQVVPVDICKVNKTGGTVKQAQTL